MQVQVSFIILEFLLKEVDYNAIDFFTFMNLLNLYLECTLYFASNIFFEFYNGSIICRRRLCGVFSTSPDTRKWLVLDCTYEMT